jgi:hypothetical protein
MAGVHHAVMAGAAQSSGAAPAAFTEGQWTAVGNMAGGTVVLTIDDVPPGTTDIEYRIDGGAEVSLGSAAPDDYNITGLTNWTEVDVEIRATNGAGDSAWSTSKPATPESPNLITNPSFATDTTGWTVNSTTWARETGPTRMKHTHNGTNTLELSWGDLSLVAGHTYRLRGKLRERSGNGAGGAPALTSGSNSFFAASPNTTADHDYDQTVVAQTGNNRLRLPGATAFTFSWTDIILQDLDDI